MPGGGRNPSRMPCHASTGLTSQKAMLARGMVKVDIVTVCITDAEIENALQRAPNALVARCSGRLVERVQFT